MEYDSGERTFVALSASAGGVDVCLSTPSLQLEPAYIGLCSQKTLKIVNRSEIPVKFSWEAFATSEEEEVLVLSTHAASTLAVNTNATDTTSIFGKSSMSSRA